MHKTVNCYCLSKDDPLKPEGYAAHAIIAVFLTHHATHPSVFWHCWLGNWRVSCLLGPA